MTRLRYQALAIIGGVFLADRLTKWWVESRLGLYEVYSILPGLFNFTHARNTGAAFSILADASPTVRLLVLIIAALGITALLAHMLWQATGAAGGPLLTRVGLSLVLGGAFGNLYDRILYGHVTDFLQVFLGSYEWPTFNVADSAICVGAGLLTLDALRQHRQQARVRTT